MRLGTSLKVAHMVLTEMFAHEDAGKVDGYIGSYQNGREQGYSLVVSGLDNEGKYKTTSISFSEFRRSDQIVVYVGQMAMQSLSEDAYSNRHYFGYGDYEKAANFIMKTALELTKTKE